MQLLILPVLRKFYRQNKQCEIFLMQKHHLFQNEYLSRDYTVQALISLIPAADGYATQDVEL